MHAYRQRRLSFVVFDMDGVLVDVESSWQFVHEAFGKNNWENVNRYLSHQITYNELLRRDIALWGRVHINEISNILSKAPLMLGAKEAFEGLRRAGLKTGLISAGVSILADRLKVILGLDVVYANRILTDQQGFLTGEGEEIVDLLDKLKMLKKLVGLEHVPLSECAVVGDSVYDISLFSEAGLGIAFNTKKEVVRKAADVVIEKKDLREILPHILKRALLSGQ